MKPRRGRGAEGAAAFAFTNLGVDPVFGKKLAGDVSESRVESFEGFEDRLLSLSIGEGRDLFADGRVLIMKRETGQLK